MKQTGPTPNSAGPPATNSSQSTQPASAAPTVQFDVSNLQSSYVSSTREEVVLAFGANNVWERGQANMQVQLTNRIVLNPFAAKRLAGVLTRVVTEYETRFGTLHDDATSQTNAA
jgi:hypothetical protein